MNKSYIEWLDYYENATKEDVIQDMFLDINSIKEKDKEIERLNKENNDLKRIYRNTYNRLFENGNDELARYFQAQIDDCPTFYVEPIVDYYEETKKLNNIINELEKYIVEEIDDAQEELNIIMQGNDLDYKNECTKEFNCIKNALDMLLDKLKALKEGK